jgi:hypothetical protein
MLFGRSRSLVQGPDQRKNEKRDKKSVERAPSAFTRQKVVESGVVQNGFSSLPLSVTDGRLWIVSSVKLCSRVVGRLSIVVFERSSTTEVIAESGFRVHRLKSIMIPSSVVVLGKDSFSGCGSLQSVMFESGSRLEQIGEHAFYQSGLKSIVIPRSVVVLGKSNFYQCASLESVAFESGSRLKRIDRSVFPQSRVDFRLVRNEFARSKTNHGEEAQEGEDQEEEVPIFLRGRMWGQEMRFLIWA